jgi:hypothetical protein
LAGEAASLDVVNAVKELVIPAIGVLIGWLVARQKGRDDRQLELLKADLRPYIDSKARLAERKWKALEELWNLAFDAYHKARVAVSFMQQVYSGEGKSGPELLALGQALSLNADELQKVAELQPGRQRQDCFVLLQKQKDHFEAEKASKAFDRHRSLAKLYLPNESAALAETLGDLVFEALVEAGIELRYDYEAARRGGDDRFPVQRITRDKFKNEGEAKLDALLSAIRDAMATAEIVASA